MDNKEIASIVKLTGQLMELYGENKFKVRSYSNAAFQIGRHAKPLMGMGSAELEQVNGVGKSVAQKIEELLHTGKINMLEEYISKTPSGVLEMLSIKGIGPSKVRMLWQEMDIESPGELLQACNENRLIELKGFGEKTQQEVKKNIEYKISNSGKFHYSVVEPLAIELEKELKEKYGDNNVSLTGAIRRKCQVIENIELLVATTEVIDKDQNIPVPVEIKTCTEQNFSTELVKTTAAPEHLKKLGNLPESAQTEQEFYEKTGNPFIIPEMREGLFEFEWAKKNNPQDLITDNDLKGILHNHSNWSDGRNSVEEIANECIKLGKEYLGMCDHSQTAVYAKGLQPERVLQQQAEIDALNQKLVPFKIFKGIESDILYDGSLDYEPEILKTFDFVVASVHSQLKMDAEKANSRLLAAIENPHTTMLGHPTGRLLLSREGYPIDHKKIIDACAANGVVIELNANPMRLDLDWQWIPYAMGKGVRISINPDAHNLQGLAHTKYGVNVARKGGLTQSMTFNAKTAVEVEEFFKSKKP